MLSSGRESQTNIYVERPATKTSFSCKLTLCVFSKYQQQLFLCQKRILCWHSLLVNLPQVSLKFRVSFKALQLALIQMC